MGIWEYGNKGNKRDIPYSHISSIPNTFDSDSDAKYLLYFISFNHQLNSYIL